MERFRKRDDQHTPLSGPPIRPQPPRKRSLLARVLSLAKHKRTDRTLAPAPDSYTTTESGPHLYFIQQGERGPIKIGKARDPRARLANMQVGNAQRLYLLGIIPNGSTFEPVLHRAFWRNRIRGEWFSPTPALLAYIAEYAERPGASELDDPLLDVLAHAAAASSSYSQQLLEATE